MIGELVTRLKGIARCVNSRADPEVRLAEREVAAPVAENVDERKHPVRADHIRVRDIENIRRGKGIAARDKRIADALSSVFAGKREDFHIVCNLRDVLMQNLGRRGAATRVLGGVARRAARLAVAS